MILMMGPDMGFMVQGNLILACALFALGFTGVLWKRNSIALFMCIELMFNAANLALLTFSQALGIASGAAVFLFIITIAASEAAIGLALFIKLFNDRNTIDVEQIQLLKR